MRVGAQLVLAVGAATAVTIGVPAVLLLRSHRRALMDERAHNVHQISETIKSSTYHDMLENRRDNLQRQIATIGRQPGITSVRLFNKEGRIVFASDAAEVGRRVDKGSESCVACHSGGRPAERLGRDRRSRVFTDGEGNRVLGVINPIDNQPGCATECHAHGPDDKVLGILDVGVSLREVDRNVAQSQSAMAGLAFAAVLAGGALLWGLTHHLVARPVAALAEATRRVAAGDLSATVRTHGGTELVALAESFNEMSRRLGEAQRQLAQADKLAAVGRLAAGLAHEINNPLTAVLTYASFWEKRSRNNPPLHDDLEVMVRETMRCREIVKGLLDFSRQTPPQRRRIDVNEVVRRAVAVVAHPIERSRIALSLELAGDIPPVEADPNQVQQVLVNLLLNAVDAAPVDSGRIGVTTRSGTMTPWRHEPIPAATCPNGCDVLDPTFRFGGRPALRVVRVCGGQETTMHLDPVYGSFRQSPVASQGGSTPQLFCPGCRVSLMSGQRRCDTCGGPTFSLRDGAGEPIWWCAQGCPWSRWEAAEARGERPVVEIQVEDNGDGMPPEVRARLFEPFFTTKGSQGTGLGLAVTWGIVQGHGGVVEVDSAPGRGSRFTVRLPVAGEEGVTHIRAGASAGGRS